MSEATSVQVREVVARPMSAPWGNALEYLRANALVLDRDLRIVYLNAQARGTLGRLADVLPVSADELIGVGIGVLGLDVEALRATLGEPSNLPYWVNLTIGERTLGFNIDACADDAGHHEGWSVAFADITERNKAEAEAARWRHMIEHLPICVIAADPDGSIRYVNPEFVRETGEAGFAFDPAGLVGRSIREIHGSGADWLEGLLGDPGAMPDKRTVEIGAHSVEVHVAGVSDNAGTYLGAMVAWKLVNSDVKLIKEVEKAAALLASAANGLESDSTSMTDAADRTAQQVASAAAASERTNDTVAHVEMTAGRLSAALGDLIGHVSLASETAAQAVVDADMTRDTINGLGESGKSIGELVGVIASIADQTNLLALNATIEAARAGEAGRGFTVVANEVKELSRQTAKATDQIVRTIGDVQSGTDRAVAAIAEVTGVIAEIRGISSTIQQVIESQQAGTEEMAERANAAARDALDAYDYIGSVRSLSVDTSARAANVLAASRRLAEEAVRLSRSVAEHLESRNLT